MSGKGWGAVGEDFEKYGYQEFVDAIKAIVEEEAPGAIFHPSFCDFGEHHVWMAMPIGRAATYPTKTSTSTQTLTLFGIQDHRFARPSDIANDADTARNVVTTEQWFSAMV